MIGVLFLSFVSMIAYAAYLSGAKSVWFGKNFYFLISENKHVEADSFDVKLNGGAGYLLRYARREYVVWSVYFDEEEGKAVQVSTSKDGKPTQILKICLDKLYFKGCYERKNAILYQDAFSRLYDCMEVLGLEIKRLDNGATQRSCIETLKLLIRQFSFLSKYYKGEFFSYANLCKETMRALEKIVQGVVYAKDLRYLLCALSSDFIKLAADFSL